MPLFAKESLSLLKEKIDLVEVVSSYISLKKSGKNFKACCPFHKEKTPSFVLEKGDGYYHCYGCAAHGDAISFLVHFLKISFVEAVEMLAEKFGVTLQYDKGEKKEDLQGLKKVLQESCQFFQFHLLYTKEGKEALSYLYQRDIDLDFIQNFKVGLAPKNVHLTTNFFIEKGMNRRLLEEAGLIGQKTKAPLFFSKDYLSDPRYSGKCNWFFCT